MEIVTFIGGISFFLATYFVSEGSMFKKIVMGIVVVAFLTGLPFVVITAFNLVQYMMNDYLDLALFQTTFTTALICLLVIVVGFYLTRKE
jgi:hypothetical protein